MKLSTLSLAVASIATLVLGSAAQAVAVSGSYTLGGNATSLGGGAYNLTSTVGDPTGFSVLRFIPDQLRPFADYTDLTYSYDVNAGGISGGSPRVAVVLDTDNDGIATNNDSQILINWGPDGSFADLSTGDGKSTGNLLAQNDVGRYDASDVGGSFYTNYSGAVAAGGTYNVLRFSLITDTFPGNPAGSQNIDINALTVSAVPEPTTLAALAGASSLVLRRRRA